MVLSRHAYFNGYKFTILKDKYLCVSVGNGPDLTPSNDMHTQKNEEVTLQSKGSKNQDVFGLFLCLSSIQGLDAGRSRGSVIQQLATNQASHNQH